MGSPIIFAGSNAKLLTETLVNRSGEQVLGYVSEYKSSNFTAEFRHSYLADTTGGAITVTLPAGAAGAQIRFSDAVGTWLTNNLILTPASGENFQGQAADATLVCDMDNAWVEIVWDATNTQWSILSNSVASFTLPALAENNVNIGDPSDVAQPTNTTLTGDISASYTTYEVSFTNASANIEITSNPLERGPTCYLTTTGTLPTGFSPNTRYYIVESLGDDIQLSSTYMGTGIVAGSAGSGTHTLHIGGLIPSGTTRAHWIVGGGNATAFGSTNTKVRRFAGVVLPAGGIPEVTYVDSATAGGSVTINRAGLYHVSYTDRTSSGTDTMGITINSTSAPQGLSGTNLIGIGATEADNWTCVSGMAYLAVGDVLRATADATGTYSTNSSVMFRVHLVA